MRVLLVRLRPLGDVVFTTPLLSALRRHYPEAHISYVVEPDAAPIVEVGPDQTREVRVLVSDHGKSRGPTTPIKFHIRDVATGERASHHAIGVPTMSRITVTVAASLAVSAMAARSSAENTAARYSVW